MIQYYDFAIQFTESTFLGLDSGYNPIEVDSIKHACRFERFELADNYLKSWPKDRFPASTSIVRVYNTSEIVKQRG